MRYSNEVKDYIKQNVIGTRTKDLVKLVNSKFRTEFTEQKMRAFKKNYGLKSGTPTGLNAGRPTKMYPERVRTYIENNYKGTGHKKMADTLNKKFGTNYSAEQIKNYYSRFKLNSGLTGRFKKGHVPANKGTHIGGYTPTQFKKGHVPSGYRPIGSERITVDGYIEVKIEDPKTWAPKHKVIWEKSKGPIPEGHVLIFLDGNRENIDINNLVLISRSKLAVLNKRKLLGKDRQANMTALLLADVIIKAGDRKRSAKRLRASGRN